MSDGWPEKFDNKRHLMEQGTSKRTKCGIWLTLHPSTTVVWDARIASCKSCKKDA